MRRHQLEHAIRTACQVIDRPEVVVVGSQAILGMFRIDGVDLETSVLPDGWRSRLVRVRNANSAAPSGKPQITGWCLDKEDLCVAKLCAVRRFPTEGGVQ